MANEFMLQIHTFGVDQAVLHSEEVEHRMRDLRPAYRDSLKLMEANERKGFARLKGRYVLTGATIRSLTRRGPGSIRKANRHGATFGTRVRHAHFLTKAPKDPNLGQVRKEPPGKGKSAVLFFPRTVKKRIADDLENYVAEPWGK